jgi:hypothetical protein
VVDVLENGEHHIHCPYEPDSDKTIADIAGPIENAVAKADEDYSCNAYLCRGYQFEDNSDNVLTVTAGDVLYFHVDLIAGHHPGYAVSFPICLNCSKGAN